MYSRLKNRPEGSQYYSDTTASTEEPTSIAEVLVEPACMRVHHGSWGSTATAIGVLLCAVTTAMGESSNPQTVRFSALERSLVEPLASALSAQAQPLCLESQSRCGLYMRPDGAPMPPPAPLPQGAKLRPLRASDAPTLDARWTYRSATSLPMVASMLESGDPGNVGIELEDGSLAGWVARYTDGALGMLYVEEAHRRRGLARALVMAAARALDSAGLPCFAYIVDGNEASESVFQRLGWRRVADADWLTFVPCSLDGKAPEKG